MWECPNCGRSFRNRNQSHYCGAQLSTIDAYILRQDSEKQQALRQIRKIIAQALPDAEERMSWSMPTYWRGSNIVHFAASKNHIGFYPGPEAVAAFAEALTAYKTDKGTIRIPYDRIDEQLIEEIAKWCWRNATQDKDAMAQNHDREET